MTAKIIDGRAVAQLELAQCKTRIDLLSKVARYSPRLAVILIGSDPASQIYVANKVRAARQVGVVSSRFTFPSDVAQDVVLDLIDELNEDASVHGILVQLPIPPHLSIHAILMRISHLKDVDGFHLYNVGGLVVGNTVFSPCTPFGVMKLLDSAGVELAGSNVVIVGASNIVGKPMALMMMARDATVAVCHAKTRDLAQFTIIADVLVVAAGVPGLIVREMVRRDAVVIDVGINRLSDGSIVGDVDFAGVSERASLITPVPGGVGPMTVAMLISNTVTSAERQAAA